MWVRKFGDAASESSTLWAATGPVSIQAWDACMGPTRCTPVALSYKGSEGGSKLGPVANNGKNIASGRQSLGMLPRKSLITQSNGGTPSRPDTGLQGLHADRARCLPQGRRFRGCISKLSHPHSASLSLGTPNSSPMGEKVWGCGLRIFDLVGGNGPPGYVGKGGLSMAYKVFPRCFGL